MKIEDLARLMKLSIEDTRQMLEGQDEISLDLKDRSDSSTREGFRLEIVK